MHSPFGGRIESDSVVQQLYRFFDRPGADRVEAPVPIHDTPASDPANPDMDAAAAAIATILTGPQAAEEEPGGRVLTLQVGLVQTPFDPFPKLIVNSDPPEKAPAEGLVGGWLDMYLYGQAYLGGLPMFEYALGDAESWTGPSSGLDQSLDTVLLEGDFSAGFTLSSVAADVSQVAVAAGNDYVIAVDDDFTGAGHSLTFDARSLGVGDHAMFDGSAETDASFSFFGSDGNDHFLGGAGNDSVRGLYGADTLSGGGGADRFIYTAAGESSGADYDTLADFDPAADRIDLPGTVSGFAAAVASGTLSTASFNADLGAALGGLGAAQAVWFAPDAGDLAGTIFLVVDGNGTAGYQAGEDYVFAVAGSPLADLTGHPDIFA